MFSFFPVVLYSVSQITFARNAAYEPRETNYITDALNNFVGNTVPGINGSLNANNIRSYPNPFTNDINFDLAP